MSVSGETKDWIGSGQHRSSRIQDGGDALPASQPADQPGSHGSPTGGDTNESSSRENIQEKGGKSSWPLLSLSLCLSILNLAQETTDNTPPRISNMTEQCRAVDSSAQAQREANTQRQSIGCGKQQCHAHQSVSQLVTKQQRKKARGRPLSQ